MAALNGLFPEAFERLYRKAGYAPSERLYVKGL